VRLHDGTISCESTYGKGSTFSFTVPFDVDVVPITNPSENRSQEHIEASREVPENRHVFSDIILDGDLDVLVVDDSASNRKMLSMLLRRCQISHHSAENGSACIDAISQNPHRFKLVLMDNLMPVMDGVTATKALRAMAYPNLIIGITGNAMDDDVFAFLEAGADAVLLKPLQLASLETLFKFIAAKGYCSHRGMRLKATEDTYEWAPWNTGTG
jgi:CheY-like chemotaxis protein